MYIGCFRILLEAGADINARDFDLWTPLHAAAHWGQEESCKILMEKFCDFELKNSAVICFSAQTVVLASAIITQRIASK